MSNVKVIEFLINEANQLTADTPKKVRQYTIDLLAKAVKEIAGPNVEVSSDVWVNDKAQVSWAVVCIHSEPLSRGVSLVDKDCPKPDPSFLVYASWDNAAEIFVKAIDILSEGGALHIPAIRESFKVASVPKFDPEQAIWDAMGWMVPNEYTVFFVGAVDAQAFIKCGGSAYSVIRHKDKDQHRIVYNNQHCGSGLLDNPRQVDTDKHEVLAVLPNGVYVAERRDCSWTVSTSTMNRYYDNYESAVKDAIKSSQETS